MYHLERFQEGILASVFDSLDRIQHMFWRDRQDIVDEWYCKLDALVGRVEQRLADLGRRSERAGWEVAWRLNSNQGQIR